MKNPVWLYWESFNNQVEPAYITLCRWTMLHNWSDANLIFLNPQNIDSYIPGITQHVSDIQVDVKGRLDLAVRKLKPNPINLAVKCDVIRANLLNTYGGFYIDISSVALKPINQYFELLNDQKSFFISQRQSHNKSHYPVGFYGCSKDSLIIKQYTKHINNLVSKKNNFHYNELGASALEPIVNQYLNQTTVLNENEFMPVTFEDANRVYLRTDLELEELIATNTTIFKLLSTPFKTSFSKLSIQDLYMSSTLVGKIFRHSLPQKVFDHYNNRWEQQNE